VAPSSIRDSQRKRLYDAEDAVFDKSKPPEWASVSEVQDYVDFVTATDAWKALEVGNEEPISVRDGRGRRKAAAEAFSNYITMPKWSRCKWVTLHELAHIAEAYRADYEPGYGWPGYENEHGRVVLTRTTAPHGPGYAGVYLYLVREFLGEDAHDALLESFGAHRVRVNHIEPVTVAATEPVTDDDTEPVTDSATHCLSCGMELSTVLRAHKFCSDACRWKYHSLKRSAATAAGREKICEACGVEFTAGRSDAKTCSPTCRQRLKRSRA
jgi:putative metallohydrolase (TIGR04338 family)